MIRSCGAVSGPESHSLSRPIILRAEKSMVWILKVRNESVLIALVCFGSIDLLRFIEWPAYL